MTQPPAAPPPPGQQPGQQPSAPQAGQQPAQPGQQPGQPGAATGTVRLHLQGSVLTRAITPSVAINRQWVPARFGANDLPVYAGPVTVFVQTQWMRTYGQAELSFDVRPGQTVEVWYAAPMHQFTTGSIGHEKQSSKGKGFMVGLVALVVLIVLLLVVLPAVLGS